MTKMPKGAGYVYLTYDVENRATVAHSTTSANDGERYGYAADNRRVYRNVLGTGERVMLWLGGQLLVELTPTVNGNGYWSGFTTAKTNAYFGGRRVGELNDRLGSKVNSRRTYYP